MRQTTRRDNSVPILTMYLKKISPSRVQEIFVEGQIEGLGQGFGALNSEPNYQGLLDTPN